MVTAHSEHDMEMATRQYNAMRINGIDAEMLTADQVRARIPLLNFRADARHPIHGGVSQPRGGTGRHDAVAWGYARGADTLGVDIIQNCQVLDVLKEAGRAVGVTTSLGEIRADRIGATMAGHSSILAKMAGFKLPIHSYALQAFVSEPIKPILDTVVLCPAYATSVSYTHLTLPTKRIV